VDLLSLCFYRPLCPTRFKLKAKSAKNRIRCVVFALLLTVSVVPASRAQTTEVEVISNQAWTDTGVQVTEGQPLNITANGGMNYWTGGCPEGQNCIVTPDGLPPCPDAVPPVIFPELNCVSLLGMIGQQGAAFEVGSDFQSTATSSGELYLGVNDGNFSDNTLGWTAWITSGDPCPINSVIVSADGFSGDGYPENERAVFTPPTSLADAQSACNVAAFDWQQTITSFPLPTDPSLCNLDSVTNRIHGTGKRWRSLLGLQHQTSPLNDWCSIAACLTLDPHKVTLRS
jgi:hypothetical protein